MSDKKNVPFRLNTRGADGKVQNPSPETLEAAQEIANAAAEMFWPDDWRKRFEVQNGTTHLAKAPVRIVIDHARKDEHRMLTEFEGALLREIDQLNNRNHPLSQSASEAVAVKAVTPVSSPAGEPQRGGAWPPGPPLPHGFTEQDFVARWATLLGDQYRVATAYALACEAVASAATPTGGRSGDWKKDPKVVRFLEIADIPLFDPEEDDEAFSVEVKWLRGLLDAVAGSCGGRSEAPEKDK